jgi:hypothetical protein
MAGLALASFLAACGQLVPNQVPLEANESIQVHLPQRFEHWRTALQADAQQLQQLADQWWQRWPVSVQPERSALQLVVVSSPLEANYFAGRSDLPGDATVPRTHPSKRLALVALPRDDRILADLPHPPRTWRETVRHEMAHLLMIDRKQLAEAPLWFHEGLAEAMVSLQAVAFAQSTQTALGSTWARVLRLQMREVGAEADLHRVLVGESAEIRYASWAALVVQLLAENAGPTPWRTAASRPTLGEFLSQLPAKYGSQDTWPRPRGREADFVPGGKDVVLASLPGQLVVLQAGAWDFRKPLEFALRVGRTGDAQAGILLRTSAQLATPLQMRLRVNTFGATVAAVEGADSSPPRAFQSRPQPGAVANWRTFELTWEQLSDQPGFLVLRSQGYVQHFASEFRPPFTLEFYVQDGACHFRSVHPLLPLAPPPALR